jgi:hypothetical protein
MKELVATAANVIYNENKTPLIELALIVSEPQYKAQVEGGKVTLEQYRTTETVRVICSAQALSLLLKSAVDAVEAIGEKRPEGANGE